MATSFGYEFQRKHFGFVDAKAEDFYVSQWFKSKGIFVAYRAFFLLYCLFWAIYDTIVQIPKYPDFWVFLSNWDEWAIAFYSAVALAVALYGLVRGKDSSVSCCMGNKLNWGDLRWFHHLTWVMFSAICVNAYVVTIVYWSFLSSTTPVNVEANIHQHVINSVIMTLDLFIVRFPVRFLHFIYASLMGLTYGLMTLIVHGSGFRSRFYPDILDWQNAPGISVGVILGLVIVGAPLLQLIVFGFYHLRALLARSCGCSSQKSSSPNVEMGLSDIERKNGVQNEGFQE